MRRFRRRKPRVAWLPTFGYATGPESAFLGQGYFDDSTQITTDGTPTLDYYPLTWDDSSSEAAQQSLGIGSHTLHDLVSGQEYRLRRILGSLVIGVGSGWESSGQNRSFQTLFSVSAGIIVLKTNDTGAPLGSANPSSQDHGTYPWVWQRNWTLCNGDWSSRSSFVTGAGNPVPAAGSIACGFPSNNTAFDRGANHLFDQKTARVIGQESRAFMCVSARQLQIANSSGVDRACKLMVHFQYRMLGSLRMTQGNRRNSVR